MMAGRAERRTKSFKFGNHGGKVKNPGVKREWLCLWKETGSKAKGPRECYKNGTEIVKGKGSNFLIKG